MEFVGTLMVPRTGIVNRECDVATSQEGTLRKETGLLYCCATRGKREESSKTGREGMRGTPTAIVLQSNRGKNRSRHAAKADTVAVALTIASDGEGIAIFQEAAAFSVGQRERLGTAPR